MKILISAHSLGIAAIGDMYLKEDNDYKRRKESCETRILTALIIISQLRKSPVSLTRFLAQLCVHCFQYSMLLNIDSQWLNIAFL